MRSFIREQFTDYSSLEWFCISVFPKKYCVCECQYLIYAHRHKQQGNNAMTYEEAAQHLEISPTEARREIEKQGEDWQEFVDTFGVQSVYYSDDVLEWLGW